MMSSNMNRVITWSSVVILAIAGLAAVSAKTGPAHDKVVVCYLATWAVYRPDNGSYDIANFDPDLCTHVVYAFSGLDVEADAVKSLDPWQDLKENYGKGGYERLTDLKKQYPHLKVTLAIGGWNEGSTNYSIMASDPVRRQKFVRQATDFVRKYNFDGLDLDWEYPAKRGGQPSDKQNFVLLVKELRQEFNKFNLLLTSAFGAAKDTIDAAYDIRSLSNLLDFLHIMCYDYGGSWDKKVGPNAPLRQNGILSVEYTIDYLIKMGASPSKIVMGLPFYGRTFISKLNGFYGDETDSVGFQGPYTRENGFLGYNEICVLVKNKTSGWTMSWDGPTEQAIGRYRDVVKDETRVVTYDSPRSIANKMKYAMRQNLAGAMVWSVDTDDFLGDCGPDDDTYADFTNAPGIKLVIPRRVNGNYPLLRTINEAIILSLDEIEQENIIDEENKIPHGTETGGAGQHGGASTLVQASQFMHFVTLFLVIMLAKLHFKF